MRSYLTPTKGRNSDKVDGVILGRRPWNRAIRAEPARLVLFYIKIQGPAGGGTSRARPCVAVRPRPARSKVRREFKNGQKLFAAGALWLPDEYGKRFWRSLSAHSFRETTICYYCKLMSRDRNFLRLKYFRSAVGKQNCDKSALAGQYVNSATNLRL